MQEYYFKRACKKERMYSKNAVTNTTAKHVAEGEGKEGQVCVFHLLRNHESRVGEKA